VVAEVYTIKLKFFMFYLHVVFGVSEVVDSVLLLVVTVVLSALVVSVFFNVVYGPAQSQLVLESAKPLCKARVVAVANDSGFARVYVYNTGSSLCVFDKAYAVYAGAAVAVADIVLRVEPGRVAANSTLLPYNSSWVYRLTGPRGEFVEGSP
jgi:hypothetical protein